MSNTLRDRRTALRVTQAQLADRLKVSQQTIARWESGGQIPSKYLKDLAVHLGVKVQALIGEPETGGKQETRSSAPEHEDDDTPFGAVELQFAGDGPDTLRRYPITEGERRWLLRQLGGENEEYGCGKPSAWIVLETLDDRWLAVNTSELVEVKLIDDDVEAMPPYFHPEVYKAAREFVLTEWPTDDELAKEDFPYSAALMEDVRAVLDAHGGANDDRAIHQFEHLQWESTQGRKSSLLPDDVALDNLHSLFEVGYGELAPDRFFSPSSAADGPYVTTHLRLGTLRLLEVPLQVMEEFKADLEF